MARVYRALSVARAPRVRAIAAHEINLAGKLANSFCLAVCISRAAAVSGARLLFQAGEGDIALQVFRQARHLP